jgi:hypothetical protein
LRAVWVEVDVRHSVVETILEYRKSSDIERGRLLRFASIPRSKYYDWQRRYGIAPRCL